MKLILTYLAVAIVLISCKNKDSYDLGAFNLSLKNYLNYQEEAVFELVKQAPLKVKLNQDSMAVSNQVRYLSKELLWSDGFTPNKRATEFLSSVKKSYYYGLDSNLFAYKQMKALYDSAQKHPKNQNHLVNLELLYTHQAIQFLSANRYGVTKRHYKDSASKKVTLDTLSTNDLMILAHALNKNNISIALDSLKPNNPFFTPLQRGLAHFLDSFSLSKEKVGVISKLIDSVTAYNQAREALLCYGYLDSTNYLDSASFFHAIKRFQYHHGLTVDGMVGRGTAYLMSKSNYERYQKAAISLEKLRHLTIDSSEFLFANIPSFTLRAYRNGSIKRQHRVVVGTYRTQTPTFNASMQYLILNPFWAVPYSISSTEILPKIKKAPSIIQTKGYQIQSSTMKPLDASTIDWTKVDSKNFNYRIVQTRSGGTALGKVKFIFPNNHSVFFHDTPSKSFFNSDVRAYSHGCIRVQNPLELAEYIIQRQDESVTLDSIQKIASGSTQKRFNLKKNLAVSIDYYTSLADSNGNIQFYRDVYDRDLIYERVMFQ